MSIITRHILSTLGVSFVISVILSLATLFAFPLSNWSLLWEKKMVDLPFVVFMPSLVLIIGIGLGILSGLFWRSQLKEISDCLYLLQQGRTPSISSSYQTKEIAGISQQIFRIHEHVSEQTKLSQKLANERAEDQEKQLQKIVSHERNRLARELHDSVSQQLFGASMLMSAILESNSSFEPNESKQLQMVEEMIHQSQLEMRALLLHLRPVPLHNKSLQIGIQELLAELSQKIQMQISWKLEEISLDKGMEDHLFRILQESVSNTLRHAKASSLEVLLIERDGLIIFQIVDDGTGFDVHTSKAGSYGLQNMHERAVEIGGSLKIVSIPNKGTKLEVKIPRFFQEVD